MWQPALCDGCIFKVQPHDHQCFLSIKWLSFLPMCNHYPLLPCAAVHEDFFLAVSHIPFEKFWCFCILSGRSSLKKILFFLFYSNLPSIISSKMCTPPRSPPILFAATMEISNSTILSFVHFPKPSLSFNPFLITPRIFSFPYLDTALSLSHILQKCAEKPS